ncbi:MAG: hypothetical protein ACRAVC_15485 [Trichormus sp.]
MDLKIKLPDLLNQLLSGECRNFQKKKLGSPLGAWFQQRLIA